MAPRVLTFSGRLPPAGGGAERQAALLSETLARQGVSVEVLTLRLDRDWPERETLDSGLVVHRAPIAEEGKTRALSRVFSPLIHGPRFRRFVRDLAPHFDVFHAHNASAPITAFAVRAAKRAGLKTVVKPVNIGDWFDLVSLARYGWRGRLARRWLVQDVDAWVAISAAVREDLLASGIPTRQVVSIPNGVVLPAEVLTPPERARRYLYLGRLDRGAPRDFSGLIAAFGQAADVEPELELAMVGTGDRLEEIRSLAAASPHAHRIHCPGYQQREPWLAWAHVYVQPSYFEGLSNSLLEAMASGLPCVAYDIPPNREALDDGAAGVLVPVGNRERLADALTSFATTPRLAADWGARARSRATATYDIRQTAARVRALYDELLAQA